MNYVERRDDIVWAYAGLLAVVCLGLWLGQASTEQVLGLGVPLTLLALVVLVMSRLSVQASADELRVSLGAGFFSRRIARGDILSINIVPPPSVFGVGLRLLPDGWLYSLGPVSAFVEIRLTDGSRLLIGSAQPQELAAQIWDFAST